MSRRIRDFEIVGSWVLKASLENINKGIYLKMSSRLAIKDVMVRLMSERSH